MKIWEELVLLAGVSLALAALFVGCQLESSLSYIGNAVAVYLVSRVVIGLLARLVIFLQSRNLEIVTIAVPVILSVLGYRFMTKNLKKQMYGFMAFIRARNSFRLAKRELGESVALLLSKGVYEVRDQFSRVLFLFGVLAVIALAIEVVLHAMRGFRSPKRE